MSMMDKKGTKRGLYPLVADAEAVEETEATMMTMTTTAADRPLTPGEGVVTGRIDILPTTPVTVVAEGVATLRRALPLDGMSTE